MNGTAMIAEALATLVLVPLAAACLLLLLPGRLRWLAIAAGLLPMVPAMVFLTGELLHGGEVRVELIESVDPPTDAPAELGEERHLPFGDPGPAPRVRVTCALPSAATLSGRPDARDEVA